MIKTILLKNIPAEILKDKTIRKKRLYDLALLFDNKSIKDRQEVLRLRDKARQIDNQVYLNKEWGLKGIYLF